MFVAQALSANVCCPGLVLYTDGYFDGYDPTVNPGAGEVLDRELEIYLSVCQLVGWLVGLEQYFFVRILFRMI